MAARIGSTATTGASTAGLLPFVPEDEPTPFTYRRVFEAWLDCRRRKRSSLSALAFEASCEEHLFDLTGQLATRTWHPSPSFCLVSRNDKHREVFAAPFRDCVVHHLFVRHIEPEWERVFIHDSYSCRKGKGTLAGVRRLQTFLRKATANGTSRTWVAQLDIKAFFPSIDRQRLLDMVLSRLPGKDWRWLAPTLILADPTQGAVNVCSPLRWNQVPPGKSLFGGAPGRGLPIGNLTSQFFANV